MHREEIFSKIENHITQMDLPQPIRVGIDGVDASGKTMFAEGLAEYLSKKGRNVIRASVDGFHNPKDIRYKRGRDSAEGYYRDSFNYEGLVENLLEPLGPGGSRNYKTQIFDFLNDSEVASEPKHADDDAILVFEGVFLFRPELINHWDIKVFIDADFETTVKRAGKRDQYYLGAEDEVVSKYQKRYIPGQKMYLEEVHPKDLADFVIDNTDYNNPTIIK